LSDSYHDVALHWALLVMIGTLAIFAAWPPLLTFWFDAFFGGWRPEPKPSRAAHPADGAYGT
jgi:putative membrane protein